MVHALTEPDRPKPKAHRWQFSLRTALVMMLVVGAGLGIWARQERMHKNRLALFDKYPGALVFESSFRDQNGRRLQALVFTTLSFWEGDFSTLVIADNEFHELTSKNVRGRLRPPELDKRLVLAFHTVDFDRTFTSRYSVANGITLLDQRTFNR